MSRCKRRKIGGDVGVVDAELFGDVLRVDGGEIRFLAGEVHGERGFGFGLFGGGERVDAGEREVLGVQDGLALDHGAVDRDRFGIRRRSGWAFPSAPETGR